MSMQGWPSHVTSASAADRAIAPSELVISGQSAIAVSAGARSCAAGWMFVAEARLVWLEAGLSGVEPVLLHRQPSRKTLEHWRLTRQ
jgi:hypothetical protein